jgi:tetratricopeptide repeat protein
MVAWRHAESLPICEQALALARRVGAREAEVRALTVLGGDLAHLGRGEEGVSHFRQALQLAEEIGDRIGLERAYVNFTDALTMLGRPRESARLGQSGLEALRRHLATAAADTRLGRGPGAMGGPGRRFVTLALVLEAVAAVSVQRERLHRSRCSGTD